MSEKFQQISLKPGFMKHNAYRVDIFHNGFGAPARI